MKPVIYQSIEELKSAEEHPELPLTDEERLIRYLDWLDLMLVLRNSNPVTRPTNDQQESDLKWIVLRFKR